MSQEKGPERFIRGQNNGLEIQAGAVLSFAALQHVEEMAGAFGIQESYKQDALVKTGQLLKEIFGDVNPLQRLETERQSLQSSNKDNPATNPSLQLINSALNVAEHGLLITKVADKGTHIV